MLMIDVPEGFEAFLIRLGSFTLDFRSPSISFLDRLWMPPGMLAYRR
jgi:hypothetical protein